MKKVEMNGVVYEILRNDNQCFCKEDVMEKITDYFDSFDYICGDYAYEKVRLKGFYESNHKKAKKINDIQYLEDYIKGYCSYGAKIFLLKKIR